MNQVISKAFNTPEFVDLEFLAREGKLVLTKEEKKEIKKIFSRILRNIKETI